MDFRLKLAAMSQRDIKKVVRQHKELEDFYTGGFSVKGKAPARAAAKSSQDDGGEMDKLVKEMCECCQCSLGGTRSNCVPGEGNIHAQLVFVGEAPGADEDEQGRPFVGRAGGLLDKIIAAMGLGREDVYICNVLKCRPPDNRDPKPEEIIRCMPFLQRQLDIIKPKIIVALGAHAARTLLNNNMPIGQMRGKFFDYYTSSGFGPIKLMPTFHPSYLLRNYSDDNRRLVWEDMQKVMAELGLKKKK